MTPPRRSETGALTLIEARAFPLSQSIEAIITRLANYGDPTLTRGSRGWWCYINITVTAAGARFEIKSESDHVFPLHAAMECESRMMAALESIGVKP